MPRKKKKKAFYVSALAGGTDLEICCDDPSGEQGSMLYKAPSGEDTGRDDSSCEQYCDCECLAGAGGAREAVASLPAATQPVSEGTVKSLSMQLLCAPIMLPGCTGSSSGR